jgi:DNA-binding response OmpR family regulator
MRILVVEDDRKIATFVTMGLKQAGFAVDHAINAEDALELAQSEPYDGAIVDIMLPGMDGLALVEAMRWNKILTPVLILSAKRSVDDRVKGLQRGGDDYLTKPFAFSELLARVHALIRRAMAAPGTSWMSSECPSTRCWRESGRWCRTCAAPWTPSLMTFAPPMARLRGIAEGALRAEIDAASNREALADCVEESDRVLTLLNTLIAARHPGRCVRPTARRP